MSVRGLPAPDHYVPSAYWEDRARRFASEGDGLAAVCSYGMPGFYNRMIHWTQQLALRRWIKVKPGTRVLDVGCGVGRWSSLLARQGAEVTGIDLSPTMIFEARRRAFIDDVASRCHFMTQDLAHLEIDGRFDLILGVTVLQHILDPASLRSAVTRMAQHLAPGGRMVLLEAAPECLARRCNTSVFQARERAEYLRLFAESGLQVKRIQGVDPAPFKTWVLPHLRRWPKPLGLSALAAVTLCSLPLDAPFGRIAANLSWHAVFVLEAARGDHGH